MFVAAFDRSSDDKVELVNILEIDEIEIHRKQHVRNSKRAFKAHVCSPEVEIQKKR